MPTDPCAGSVGAGAGAWTEPGAHAVAPGVHRIPLPLPGDGLRAVNVYAIEDGDRLAIVDAGWHRQDSWDALSGGLASIGAAAGDIARVLVTHIHHDHYGQAARLRAVGGAVVVLGRGEQRSLDAVRTRQKEATAHRRAQLIRRGGADLAEEARVVEEVDPTAGEGFGVWELPDLYTTDGALLELRSRALEVVTTPGHTRGHVSFFDRDAGLLFAGDHVLPHITPSVGLQPFADGHPLIDFLASLTKVRALPAAAVLPAHGPVFADLAGRVDELLAHHRGRLAACVAAVGAGRPTVLDVATALPWTRRERRFADLDLFNRLLAVHETAAHLDLLVVEGGLAVDDDAGVDRYSRPASSPAAPPAEAR